MHKKSKLLTYAAIVLLIAGTHQTSWADPAPPAAKEAAPEKTASKCNIEFEGREFDFGSVDQGEKVTHVYKFKNIGDEPLIIERVRSSCGCTAAILSSKTILPGKSGSIEATFNSTRFHGRINKTISVHSNDPDEPIVRLQLTGKVVTDLVIIPSRELFFGLIEYQKPASKSFLLTQGGDTPLQVSKAECDLPFISTEIVPGNQANKKTYQIMLHVSDKAPEGRFEGNVKIYTNLPKYKTIERKVMGVVRKLEDPKPQTGKKQQESLLPPFIKGISSQALAAK